MFWCCLAVVAVPVLLRLRRAGGGGAGGWYRSPNLFVSAGTATVTVGAGGAGGTATIGTVWWSIHFWWYSAESWRWCRW